MIAVRSRRVRRVGPLLAALTLGMVSLVSAPAVVASGVSAGVVGATRAGAAQARVIDLGTLGGGGSSAAAINARGQVAGWALTAAGKPNDFGDTDTANGVPHAVLWR